MGNCCSYQCPSTKLATTQPNFIGPGVTCPLPSDKNVGKAPQHYWAINDPTIPDNLYIKGICTSELTKNIDWALTCPCNGEFDVTPVRTRGDTISNLTCNVDTKYSIDGKTSCNIDNCEGQPCGNGSCSGGQVGTGHCHAKGVTPACVRMKFLGDPSTCCLLAAADKQTWPGTNNRLQDSTISGIPPLGWSDDYMNGSNYSCDPATQDYSNSQGENICPSAVAQRCSAQDSDTRDQWNPNTGLCFNYINSTRNLNTIQTPALVLKTTVDALNSKFPGSSVLASSDADIQTYTSNLLQACSSVPGACDSGLNTMCGNYTRQDIIDAYNRYTSNPSDIQAKNIYSACGCHLPADQYSNWAGDIDQTCDPLCQLAGSIPKGSTLGQKDQCTQSVCIMDQISVDVINSNIGDGVSFNMVCPGCSGGTCSCIFSQDTVNVLNSNVGKGINFSADCNTCAIQPDSNSPARTPIQCPNGQGTTSGGGSGTSGSGGTSTSKKWYEKHRDLLIGVLVGIAVLMIILIIFFSSSSSSSPSEGGDIQNYFDAYSF